jgi:DNA primase
MRFPPNLLDEIRARLPVSHVVGRRIKLKRFGREYKGLSPFKHEKTPSFTVNDQKGFYHCFASGEHGDIFTFLMKAEGLSFPEAVERLAQEAGVEMPKPTPQAEAREALGQRLRKITEASCAFFQAALHGREGREARAYLERRGLTEADIARFRLGYAPPGRHQLKEHLAAKGFAPDDMAASGMLIAGDDIPVSYDRFRNRLIFPISDLRGEIIAFGGRALAEDQQPKYLNSPETPIFHKGGVLYNGAEARKAAHERDGIIIAEGYMDVIALARAGFPNAVAPLGTALTPDQLALLWRMADEPLLCFDGDSAGIKAAYRAVETALPHLVPGKSLRFVFLPEGLDPDDLLRQHGAPAVATVLQTSKPLSEVLWAKEFAAGSWNTPERRAFFEQRLNELINGIADQTVRQHYSQDFRRRLREQFSGFVPGARPRDFGRRVGERGGQRPFDLRMSGGLTGSKRPGLQPFGLPGATASLTESALVRSGGSILPRREVLLIQTLLNHPWLLDDDVEEVASVQFEAESLQRLRNEILAVYSQQIPLDNMALRYHLEKLGYSGLLAQVEHAITHKSDRNTQPDASHDDVLIGWRHRLALHRRSVELKRELESAERSFASDPSEENFLRLQDLSRQLLSAGGAEAAAEAYAKSGDGTLVQDIEFNNN